MNALLAVAALSSLAYGFRERRSSRPVGDGGQGAISLVVSVALVLGTVVALAPAASAGYRRCSVAAVGERCVLDGSSVVVTKPKAFKVSRTVARASATALTITYSKAEINALSRAFAKGDGARALCGLGGLSWWVKKIPGWVGKAGGSCTALVTAYSHRLKPTLDSARAQGRCARIGWTGPVPTSRRVVDCAY